MIVADEPADRLQQLVDREEIGRLFHRYAWHFDRNEPALVAALFTADALVDYGPEVEVAVGRDVIEARVRGGLEATFAATSHHISNVEVTLRDSQNAHGTAYVYAWHRYCNGAPDGYLWGQYHNRFERTPDGWRISALRLHGAGTVDFHRLTMHPVRPS